MSYSFVFLILRFTDVNRAESPRSPRPEVKHLRSNIFLTDFFFRRTQNDMRSTENTSSLAKHARSVHCAQLRAVVSFSSAIICRHVKTPVETKKMKRINRTAKKKNHRAIVDAVLLPVVCPATVNTHTRAQCDPKGPHKRINNSVKTHPLGAGGARIRRVVFSENRLVKK